MSKKKISKKNIKKKTPKPVKVLSVFFKKMNKTMPQSNPSITNPKDDVKRYHSTAEIEQDLKERYFGPARNKVWTARITQTKWLNDLKELNPIQRCIYIDLLFYARNKDECYPSEKRIAGDLKICRGTIYRNLKKMETMGIIKIARVFGKTNLYEIKN